MTLDGKALNFASKAIVGEYAGKLNAEGTEAVGDLQAARDVQPAHPEEDRQR